MERINNIKEVLDYLKDEDIITSNGKDRFVYKNDRVYCYDDGTRFSLSVEEFVNLYKNKNFYLYEEEVLIDEQKDEAYYRYYKK